MRYRSNIILLQQLLFIILLQQSMSSNPSGQFYSSSKVISYSSNGSGQPKYYEATSETTQGPDGVSEICIMNCLIFHFKSVLSLSLGFALMSFHHFSVPSNYKKNRFSIFEKVLNKSSNIDCVNLFPSGYQNLHKK